MKALIAMSGGVDSSVAAKLMLDKGYTCIGCTMLLHGGEDASDARSVAERLSMPFHVFDFTEAFQRRVVDRFVRTYETGSTPNPCIDCNRYLKFGLLYEKAKELGCDVIVTGHYARVSQENGRFFLKKALDESKDQSYVLYHLTPEQLRHTQFPLGEMSKAEVRAIAAQSGFVSADKPDSQDICFVPDGDYAAVIERRSGKTPAPGNFMALDGTVLGQHRGLIHYTIGQRRGLALPQGERIYVCALRPQDNTVVVGPNEALFARTLVASDFQWSIAPPSGALFCEAKIRYRHKAQRAAARVLPGGTVEVTFDDAQRAITPGQSVVLYQADTVLGGGTILG